MSRKQIIPFLISLVISGIVSYGIVIVFIYSTFDLFGIRQLVDPEKYDGEFFYLALLVFGINLLAFFILFKLGRKSAARGTIVSIVLGLIVLVRMGSLYLNKANYYEAFSQTEWMADKERLKMGRKLAKDSALVGFELTEVINKIGQADRLDSSGNGTILMYHLDGAWIQLAVIVKNNKVSNTLISVQD
jgi:hypothetical protein